MNGVLLTAVVIGASVFLLWLISLPLKDASIVDLFWGTGFVIIAWLALGLTGTSPRGALVTGLVTLWGVRLSVYLAWRNHGRGEDVRYVAMRNRHPSTWPVRSLFQVFILQGVLMCLISAPVQVAIASREAIGPLDCLGALVVLVGIAFETLGDLQLARFKADPKNKGAVMTHGLWRYTRHPNYFGDALVWWGLACFGIASGAWYTIASSALMTFLLVRVSGVALLESTLKQRPGYSEYVQSTSPFFPLPPAKPDGLNEGRPPR
jgi:steroid 5-alpha reductase family enzyme